jgi:hypothetical protein
VKASVKATGDNRIAFKPDLNTKGSQSTLAGRYQAAVRHQKRCAKRYQAGPADIKREP